MFSTVFLCVKDARHSKFSCKQFESFLEADQYFNNTYNDKNVESTIVPVCKFIPAIAKRHFLQYKISNHVNRVSIV
jgi:hypothetical protein